MRSLKNKRSPIFYCCEFSNGKFRSYYLLSVRYFDRPHKAAAADALCALHQPTRTDERYIVHTTRTNLIHQAKGQPAARSSAWRCVDLSGLPRGTYVRPCVKLPHVTWAFCCSSQCCCEMDYPHIPSGSITYRLGHNHPGRDMGFAERAKP